MKTMLAALMICSSAVFAAAPPSDSLYNFGGELEDQTGAKVHLDTFEGHPVIITMFYSSCTYACPIIISSIRRMEEKLTPEARANLRVLLVSMDPEKDTPEAMTKIMKGHGADPARWKLVRPSKDGVAEIAGMLGMTYRRNPDGGYSHSAEITLMDEKGVVVSRLDAPGDDATEFLAHIHP